MIKLKHAIIYWCVTTTLLCWSIYRYAYAKGRFDEVNRKLNVIMRSK